MILYLGNSAGLKDADLPHRSKALTLIKDDYHHKHESLKNNFKVCSLCHVILDMNAYYIYQVALGRVSLTSDMWQDPNKRSFMAVTAHWIARGSSNRLELLSALIAFREVEGCHTGNHLGQVLFDIVQDIGIAHKVCIDHAFTLRK